jgi:hypothetical protein
MQSQTNRILQEIKDWGMTLNHYDMAPSGRTELSVNELDGMYVSDDIESVLRNLRADASALRKHNVEAAAKFFFGCDVDSMNFGKVSSGWEARMSLENIRATKIKSCGHNRLECADALVKAIQAQAQADFEEYLANCDRSVCNSVEYTEGWPEKIIVNDTHYMGATFAESAEVALKRAMPKTDIQLALSHPSEWEVFYSRGVPGMTFTGEATIVTMEQFIPVNDALAIERARENTCRKTNSDLLRNFLDRTDAELERR